MAVPRTRRYKLTMMPTGVPCDMRRRKRADEEERRRSLYARAELVCGDVLRVALLVAIGAGLGGLLRAAWL